MDSSMSLRVSVTGSLQVGFVIVFDKCYALVKRWHMWMPGSMILNGAIEDTCCLSRSALNTNSKSNTFGCGLLCFPPLGEVDTPARLQ